MNDPKIRDKMIILLGQIDAIRYPLIWNTDTQGYYDLLDSIRDQYVYILKHTIGYEE